MIIHQFFLGDIQKQERFFKYQQNIEKFCLENKIEYIFWDYERIIKDNYIKKYYDRCTIFNENPVFISDFMRIVILKKYGGLYLDCDFEIINKNFINFFDNHIFTIGEYSKTIKNYYLNCLIYSKLNNQIIDKLVEMYFMDSFFRTIYHFKSKITINVDIFIFLIDLIKNDDVNIVDYDYFILDGKRENINEKTLLFHNHYKSAWDFMKRK